MKMLFHKVNLYQARTVGPLPNIFYKEMCMCCHFAEFVYDRRATYGGFPWTWKIFNRREKKSFMNLEITLFLSQEVDFKDTILKDKLKRIAKEI